MVVLVLGILSAGSLGAEPTRHEFESKHMGVTFRIVLYANDREAAEKASKSAFDRVAELDQTFSDYKQDSDLMKLCKANDAEPGKGFKVSEDFLKVLMAAEKLSKQSDGAFDITVGPVVQLWRLARRTQQLPDTKELGEAMAKVGYEKISIHPSTSEVKLKLPGMRLDFGGIAKGYAADEALLVLSSKFNIKRALVAASGDITCGDPPPGKEGWSVDIAPIAKGQPVRNLTLSNAAVSTSGDLEQFVEIEGVRYSHIVNPKTGLGLTGRRSVTVIAKRGIDADSLTKAASILPAEKALTLIDSIEGAATHIVVKENDEKPMVITESKRFEQYLAK